MINGGQLSTGHQYCILSSIVSAVEREPPSESDGGSQGVCYAVSLVMRHKHTLSVRPKTKYKFDNMRHQQTLSVRPKTTF